MHIILTLFLSFVFTITCLTASAKTSKPFSGHTIAKKGAWCWFADPRAMHYENKALGINATYVGYIDSEGSIKATQVDWNTKTTSEVMVRSWFQPDDHDNPSFLALPDGRIMIIYSRHTDEACFYYRISRQPGDITDLGEEKRLATANNTTYPNPYILSDDPNHIYMCWRGIGWHPTVAQMSMPDANDDIHFTWGPFQMVQSSGARPYAKYISNGKDKIYLAYTTGHPDNENPNWLYCNYFDINNKKLYDLKGEVLSDVSEGTFRVNKSEDYRQHYPATIVDATPGKRDWIWNMAFSENGTPVIGFTKISPDKQHHEYHYAKWNGNQWNTHFITYGGKYFHHSAHTENCYSSGMAIDRDDIRTVYCGVPVQGVHEIWKYRLDEECNVIDSCAITTNSEKSNARPFVIEGTRNAKKGADKLRLMWMNGDYYFWISNTRYKDAYPTRIATNGKLPVNKKAKKGFTISAICAIDKEKYVGDMLTSGAIVFGVDNNQHSYVKINGKTFTSQNVLGTAKSWQTENRATTDGKWYSKTKLDSFHLAISADASYLTIYINGIIDQKIAHNAITTPEGVTPTDKMTIKHPRIYDKCLAESVIKMIANE